MSEMMPEIESPGGAARGGGVRRWLLAASSVGTAVALFASEAVDPVGEGTAEHFWSAANSHNGRLVASALLLLLSSVLLIPAAAAVQRLAHTKGATLAAVGSTLLVLGAFGHAMLATLYLIVSVMPSADLDGAQALTLLDRLNESANLVVAFPLILAFGFGLLLSFVALRRATAVPTWVLGTVVGAFLLEVVAPGDAGLPVALVKQALGVVAFSYLALRVVQPLPSTGGKTGEAPMRMSDATGDRPLGLLAGRVRQWTGVNSLQHPHPPPRQFQD